MSAVFTKAVIVGGGQAAGWIARTLRAEGFTGSVTIVGDEAHCPYERPPLSKGVLKGEASLESMTMLGADDAVRLDIVLACNTCVTRIDRATGHVICANGETLAYDRLFLATGSRPRTFPTLAPTQSGRLHVLRSQDDAIRLRRNLVAGNHLVVVGGGWIGLEVAATARHLGLQVTVIEANPYLCARSLAPMVSDYLLERHRAAGVVAHLETQVEAIDASGDGVTVVLADGSVILADEVLLCLGARPNDELAREAGLAVNDGILVDRIGRTSDPAIFAAGDVARFPSAGHMVRGESWANAQHQGIAAAKSALGGACDYAILPWFWSDQYDMNIQIVGAPERAVHIEQVAASDPSRNGPGWIARDADGLMIGAVAVNNAKFIRRIRADMMASS